MGGQNYPNIWRQSAWGAAGCTPFSGCSRMSGLGLALVELNHVCNITPAHICNHPFCLLFLSQCRTPIFNPDTQESQTWPHHLANHGGCNKALLHGHQKKNSPFWRGVLVLSMVYIFQFWFPKMMSKWCGMSFLSDAANKGFCWGFSMQNAYYNGWTLL